MSATHLNIAIIDMYDGNTNVGMECIQLLLAHWSQDRNASIEHQIFKLRDCCEIPHDGFDAYISTGGPGSPVDSKDEPWDNLYTNWLNQMIAIKKPVFLICHSFQIACRHFNLGKISLRKSRQVGILPVHPIKYNDLFEGLEDPFYALESRLYQITEPNDELINSMGARITCLEKIRPQVPLERAIMGIQFNEHMAGVQFHPEGEYHILLNYFKEEKIKNSIIEEFGIEKWERMIEQLNDPKKIKSTYHAIIPNFLDKALKAKS
jgi:GMP synthase-like glutamine amidotransferase